ncbi:MAG: sigma-54-dependent transcriptional regulator, partial [Nannocystaceae bacterium]
RVRNGQIIEIGRSFWLLRSSTSRPENSDREEIASSNPNLSEVTKRLERIGRSSIPLLFAGETGVGKEHLARVLHKQSGRRGAFIKQNLSALPEDRFDEILFGSRKSEGIFQRAHNGTLFFDELDALSAEQQAKLNTALSNIPHALEQRTGLPARIVCASHLDLHKLVSKHEFRGDLFSKIAGYQARIPPLRERREDLGRLCRAFLKQNSIGNKAQLVTRAFRRLLIHSWPFNIRELKQTLSTAIVLSSAGGSITLDMIEEIMNRREGLPQTPESVEELRRELIRNLAKHESSVPHVARAMGRDVAEIIRLIERFGLHSESSAGGRSFDHTIAD